MKITKSRKLVSFEFQNKEAATHFAQRIANACGGTVKVIDGTGSDIALAKPQHLRARTMTIAAVQALADEMDAKIKH